MAEFPKGKTAVKLPDERQRQRRAKLIAIAKPAEAEEGRLLVEAVTEVGPIIARAAQELKTQPARQDFEGAVRRR